MPSRRLEFFFRSRAVRWLLPAALLALTPKCLLCVLAYAGLGAALGLGTSELCGAATGSPALWTSVLAWVGLTGGVITLGFLACCRRGRCIAGPRNQVTSTRS